VDGGVEVEDMVVVRTRIEGELSYFEGTVVAMIDEVCVWGGGGGGGGRGEGGGVGVVEYVVEYIALDQTIAA